MIYFILYLFLEVMISSSVASAIGGFSTFLEILFTAILGVFILKNFKYSLTDSINKARTGQITQEEFIKTNVGRGIGALLLIIPGFFTDGLGIILQFGFMVTLFSKIFKFKTPQQNHTQYSNDFEFKQTNHNNTTYKGNKHEEIIDVEIIDDSNAIKH